MKWIIAGIITLLTSVESLRYLTCAQKNNYVLEINKKTLKYYFAVTATVVPIVLSEIFMPSGTLGDSIKIIICCIVAASVYVYTNSFATKPVFTDRAKKIYSVTMCYAVVSVIPIVVAFKGKTAVFVLCGIKYIIPVYTFLSLISTRRYFEKKNETYIKKQSEKLAD
ncbi:MAG: hypothetical protein ACI4SK_05425, partial [Christensenellales bacterium]